MKPHNYRVFNKFESFSSNTSEEGKEVDKKQISGDLSSESIGVSNVSDDLEQISKKWESPINVQAPMQMKSRLNLHRKIAILGKEGEELRTLCKNIIHASNFNLSKTQIHAWATKQEVFSFLHQNRIKGIDDSETFGIKDFETQNTLNLIFFNFNDKSCLNLV
jgi:ATPase subunit of ABC transporter with duplicated ATPase domains